MTRFADLCADLDKQLDALHLTLRAPEAPPCPLFHYTTAEGLLGITKNDRLWASDCRYLNDVSEPRYAQSVIKEAVTNLAHTVTAGSFTEQILGQFWNWAEYVLNAKAVTAPPHLGIPIPSSQAPDLYVFCLSEEADLLSQWRAYSDHGSGYALGFSDTKLLGLVQAIWSQYLVRVIYDKGDQLKLAENDLGKIATLLDQFEKKASPLDDDRKEWITRKLFQSLLNEAIRLQGKFKTPAYREEKEWRILQFVHPASTSIPIHFRAARNRVVPYLELDFHEPKKLPLPIEHVTAGPTHDPTLSKDALTMLFSKRGYSGVTIENSRVPFRQ